MTGKKVYDKKFEPLSPGSYVAVVDKLEETKNSKGTGRNAKLRFRVTEGEKEKSIIWMYLNNIVHSNAKAQEIARERMDEILKASGFTAGFAGISDRSEILETLQDKPVVITVGMSEARDYVDKDGNNKTFDSRPEIIAVSAL